MPVTLSYAAAAEGNGWLACLPSRAGVHADIYLYIYISFPFPFPFPFPSSFPFCSLSWIVAGSCYGSYRYSPPGDGLVVVCYAGRIRGRRVFVGVMRDDGGRGAGPSDPSGCGIHSTRQMGRCLKLWLEELYRLLHSLFARI